MFTAKSAQLAKVLDPKEIDSAPIFQLGIILPASMEMSDAVPSSISILEVGVIYKQSGKDDSSYTFTLKYS